ncbi:MAG: radical SAM protein [Oscillospiraceae bacterium]
MTEIEKIADIMTAPEAALRLSGGEPLLQSDFVAELFKTCKDEGIQTCIESTFFAPWEEVEKILPYTDVIISDLKHMDTQIHWKYTGVHSETILRNLKRLTDEGRTLILRIPVIPEVNDNIWRIWRPRRSSSSMSSTTESAFFSF